MAKKIPVDTQLLAVKVLRQVDGMRGEKKHCDFLIKVGSEEIPAHRNILSATSDYFGAMFSHPTEENKSGVVEMMGVDPECAIICIDHMYGKEVSILPDKYEPLMYVATLMQLHTLRDAVIALVEGNLDVESFYIAKRIASLYESEALEDKCKEFAENNFGSLSKEEEFSELLKSFIEQMMKSTSANISEKEKLSGLLIWTNSSSERTSFFPEMVGHINLNKVPVACRRYLIEKESLIREHADLFREFLNSMLNTLNVGTEPIGTASEKMVRTILIFDGKSNHLQRFNPSTNTWKQMHEMNDDMRTERFSAVSLDDSIFVLLSNKSVYRLRCSDTAETWQRMADMHETHGLHPPAAVFSGFIYVIGSHGKGYSSSVEVYVPSANKWIKLKDKPELSFCSEVISSPRCIFSFDGRVNHEYSDEIMQFDPIESTWSHLTSMDKLKASVAAVSCGSGLYVLGGYGKEDNEDYGNRFSSTSRFDLDALTWTSLQSMSIPRSLFRAFVIEGHIYAVGGYNSSPDSIEKYDIENDEWEMVEMPSGMNLKILESVEMPLSV